ncbi:nuclear transport factor 2 family protein [Streptomyces sp. SID13031]|uniref:nuclear transport factor 2 family protein n=1 Tax=Streptomyces sp. SID13031 TaxID=2706046 RepID=UPI0013CC28B8|nr:nuclear transport factor 2 family protein [Streptomyces sp. SID13031]NEA33513.1 nuclear transport factor 2 family protein [Streptomyces sp. SID13031]
MATIQQVAEAFSSHQFREIYEFLHPEVEWTLVGAARLEGIDQVRAACEQSLGQLARTTTQFLRFKTIAGPDAVAIDSVAKYVDAKWNASIVRSCDVYEFTEGFLTTITSYTAEIQAADLP